MLNSLFPLKLCRRLEWQLIRMVSSMTVMRIVTEMMVFAVNMRRGVHWIVNAVAERSSKCGRIIATMCGVFWVFNCRSKIAVFAWLSQMARQMVRQRNRHDFGVLTCYSGKRLNVPRYGVG